MDRPVEPRHRRAGLIASRLIAPRLLAPVASFGTTCMRGDSRQLSDVSRHAICSMHGEANKIRGLCQRAIRAHKKLNTPRPVASSRSATAEHAHACCQATFPKSPHAALVAQQPRAVSPALSNQPLWRLARTIEEAPAKRQAQPSAWHRVRLFGKRRLSRKSPPCFQKLSTLIYLHAVRPNERRPRDVSAEG